MLFGRINIFTLTARHYMLLSFDWRAINLAVVYGCYSIIRKSFGIAMPAMLDTLKITKVDLGIMTTNFSVAYGISKLLGGILSDMYPPHILFLGGLLLGSVANILVASYTDVTSICALWFINGLVQGVGWASLTKLIAPPFFTEDMVGRYWSLVICGGNLGYLVAPLLFVPLVQFGWQAPFVSAGLLGLGVIATVILFTKQLSFRRLSFDTGMKKYEKSVGSATILLTTAYNAIFAERSFAFFWSVSFLSLSSAMTYFVLKGMVDWYGTYNAKQLVLRLSFSANITN